MAVRPSDNGVIVQPILSVKNLSLTYTTRLSFFRSEKHLALDNLNFDIEEGETLGILGSNGSGKSTLLRVLAGIYQPDKGEVKTRSKNVSLLSLMLGFDGSLSGYDNAIFGGMLLGYGKKEVYGKLPEIEAFSDLGNSFYAPVRTYSSGMISRLAFSISITMEPDIMLLDEVLSVGDQQFREKAEAAMISKMSSSITTVFVSHSAEQIARLCDRAILLESGRLIMIGNVENVIARYQSGGVAVK